MEILKAWIENCGGMMNYSLKRLQNALENNTTKDLADWELLMYEMLKANKVK